MSGDHDGQNPPVSALYELVLEARAGTESNIRQHAADFFAPIMQDPDGADRLVVATQELLDNAVQHGRSKIPVLRIAIEPLGPTSRLVITTSNEATAEDSRAVTKAIEEMRSVDDVGSYYREIVRRNRSLFDRSGLGLARVFAEAGMVVDAQFDGAQLTVSAEMQLVNGLRPNRAGQ